MVLKKKEGFLPTIKPLLLDLRELVVKATDFLVDIEKMRSGGVLSIDTLRLEQQCAEQPDLISKIGACVAELRYIEKGAEALQKTLESRFKVMVRNHPGDFSLEKVTDKSVEEVFIGSREFLKGHEFCALIGKAVEKAKNAMLALEHRRSMLRVEERLFSGEYFNIEQPLHLSRQIREKTFDEKRKRVGELKRAKKDREEEDDTEEENSLGTS